MCTVCATNMVLEGSRLGSVLVFVIMIVHDKNTKIFSGGESRVISFFCQIQYYCTYHNIFFFKYVWPEILNQPVLTVT